MYPASMRGKQVGVEQLKEAFSKVAGLDMDAIVWVEPKVQEGGSSGSSDAAPVLCS